MYLWQSETWRPEDVRAEEFFLVNWSVPLDLAWSRDGELLALASIRDQVHVWPRRPTPIDPVWLGRHSGVLNVAFSPDGRLLASASDDRMVIIWELGSRRQRARLAHAGGVTSVSFSPDGRLLASKSTDHTIRIWRCDDWRTVAVIDEHTHRSFIRIAFHPTWNVLATYGQDEHVVRIWDVDPDVLLSSPG